MKTNRLIITTAWIGICLASTSGIARAHCDALDGPVVQAAQKALAASNVNLVLIWVQKDDEPEIKRAFDKTVAVRKLGAEAKELADLYFFETVVRVHRAGEGAPYTGLQPAGQDLDLVIPVADAALRDGKLQPVLGFLTHELERGVQAHFAAVLQRRDFDKNDVEAGREFVQAYVEYIHCVQALHEQASRRVHGHFRAAGEDHAHPKEAQTPGHQHGAPLKTYTPAPSLKNTGERQAPAQSEHKH